MISGFVIYLSLENMFSVKKFAFSRFFRLYPAYWFAVLITFLAVLVFSLPGRDVPFSEMLINLTMLNGFIGVPSVDRVYWTLRVELTFYFIIAALYFLVTKKQLLITFLGLVGFSFIVKYLYGLGDVNSLIKLLKFIFSLDYLHFFGAGIGFYLLTKKENYLLACALIIASIAYNLFYEVGNG